MIKTDKVKVVIFSGGTGAASLMEGLKKFDSTKKAFQITSIINGYDDGASGGIVRNVMQVLCPGDLRKNQIKQHIYTHGENHNRALDEFANNRYDLTPGNELNDVLNLLDKWDFEHKELYKKLVGLFFNVPNSKKYTYTGFNISNIIYSAMIKQRGYKETFKHFKQVFKISDDVVLVSEEHLQLCGITESGSIIETETPGIISRGIANVEDPIVDIFFAPFNRNNLSNSSVDHWYNTKKELEIYPAPSNEAREKILDADLIIFAPGTQWSSLIPSYKTKGINDIIQSSKARKILLMNNREDGDTAGQTAGEILNSISKYLNLDNIDIFINKDTTSEKLKDTTLFSGNISTNITYKNLGLVDNDKHDSYLTAKEILKRYYGFNGTSILFLDFDDTVYSRDPEHSEISNINLEVLNNISKEFRCVVVSGNDYATIHKKLVDKFGTNLSKNKIYFDIWADGGVVKYENGKIIHRSDNHILQLADLIYDELINTAGIPKEKIFLRGDWPKQDFNKLTCIGIKPLTDLEKRLLILLLNGEFYTSPLTRANQAKIIGLTGIDILNINADKIYAFDYYGLDENVSTFYIGDELKDGNDENISKRCLGKYSVKSPYDTNILLNLIKEETQ